MTACARSSDTTAPGTNSIIGQCTRRSSARARQHKQVIKASVVAKYPQLGLDLFRFDIAPTHRGPNPTQATGHRPRLLQPM
jgi:hypothetical protein